MRSLESVDDDPQIDAGAPRGAERKTVRGELTRMRAAR
jgi:hypothetical protein